MKHLPLLALGLCLSALAAPIAVSASKPNIILIVADDLGYGDVSCYGAARIKTPNMDRLASEGLRFTDGHATSATCTPSRYAILTGEYPWRKKGTAILPGDAALIIDPAQATIPSVLKRAGYRSCAIGKWHLGLGPQGGPNWNGEIKPGPLDIGFTECFIMPATGDRVPCVFVRDRRVAGLDPADPLEVSFDHKVGQEPTGEDHPELLKMKPSHGHNQTIINGISRIGYMSGGKAARWVDENIADTLTKQAVGFIERNSKQPFFLYFASHDPHVPRVPHPRFVGKSGCGIRGDAIVQFDWCVGEILGTVDRLGLSQNTLVVLTSDNGPVVDDGYMDGAVKDLNGHRPAGALRGGKYSRFEGGTRVPLITRWPKRIKPGVSDALVSHVDFLATFAVLAGEKPSAGEGPDSRDSLKAFLGEDRGGRQQLIEHANGLAVRAGEWKWLEPSNGPKWNKPTNTELGNDPAPQLYNLEKDLGETTNLAPEQPEKANALKAELESIRKAGRMP